MQLTRQRKEELVDEIAEKLDTYPVIGVLDMHSLPARQLQEIKKELVGAADIQMTRKTLIALALEQSSKSNITALQDNTAIQPALIFTEKNPFSLYNIIQQKKSAAPASGGEIAPNDITITAGKTDIDPGPMLGRIQELGAGTEVADGKIKITNDTVAVEEGEEITPAVAEVLNQLGMEPLEVGLDLKLVYENEEVFDKSVLAIDTDQYAADVEAAAGHAFNLGVDAGIMTPATATPILQNAFSRARSLAINAGVIVDEVLDELMQKGAGEAAALEAALDLDAAATKEVDAEDHADDNDSADGAETGEEQGDDEDEDTDADGDNDATTDQTEEPETDGGDT